MRALEDMTASANTITVSATDDVRAKVNGIDANIGGDITAHGAGMFGFSTDSLNIESVGSAIVTVGQDAAQSLRGSGVVEAGANVVVNAAATMQATAGGERREEEAKAATMHVYPSHVMHRLEIPGQI